MYRPAVTFGIPDEWEAFVKEHPVLTDKLRFLFETFTKVFIRKLPMETPADRVVFFLGRLCVEDFMEILLLCGNGYGLGGLKILRSLYERAVTAIYIARNPKEAGTFLGYHHVHMGKYLTHAEKSFDLSRISLPERLEEVKKSYRQAKRKYQETLCKKCGSQRIQSSWTKLDMVSMARSVGLDGLYLPCYFAPTLQVHATVSSLVARMKETGDGQVSFDEGTRRQKASEALIGAHDIILHVLSTENEYFDLDLDTEIQKCGDDFMSVWKKKADAAKRQAEARAAEEKVGKARRP